MYGYSHSEKADVEISLTQIIMAVAVVIVFFAIPAAYIQRGSNSEPESTPYTSTAISQREVSTTPTEGRVAGITDSKTTKIRIPLTAVYIEFNSEVTMLAAIGTGLVLTSLCLTIYLLITPQEKHYWKENGD